MLPALIEPEVLAENLDDDRLMIIDLSSDENYARFHLPGAIHVNPAELVSGVKPAVGKLPSIERLTALFSRIGYTAEKHIIAYDDEGGGWAGRFIWTLDVIGHQFSSYLNGGLVAWATSKLPLTEEVTDVTATNVDLSINPSVIASKAEVLSNIDDSSVVIWDARSAEEYAGMKVVAARGGHIPGAINLDWLELMDRDRQLRLVENVDELLATRGLDQADTVITHCQSHHRSGLTYLVGKLAGLNIKAYDGSWSEWGNDPDTPIDNPSA